MRMIDADTLRQEVEKDRDASDMPKMWYQGIEYAINHIIHAPTVDAVEVVRCKDCRWGREACGNIECSVDSNLPPEYHGYEWFCPNGERREER